MISEKRTTVKEVVILGIFSTIIMDIGYVFLKVSNIVSGSNEPQFLGRWILNMFHGVFIQNDISAVAAAGIEKPISLIVHYLTGIILAAVFLWLRNRYKLFSGSALKGLVFGWMTLVLPWFFFYPCLGFGFMGLDTPEGFSNIVYSIIYHSFYGLGITLWLVRNRKVMIKQA